MTVMCQQIGIVLCNVLQSTSQSLPPSLITLPCPDNLITDYSSSLPQTTIEREIVVGELTQFSSVVSLMEITTARH